MDIEVKADLIKSFYENFEPPFQGEVYEWAAKNIVLPSNYAIGGALDIVNLSPYLIEPYKDLLRDTVEEIILSSARQTFKSGFVESTLAYIICNDPGPVLKVHQTKEVADTFTLGRLIPLFQSCKPLSALLEDNKKSIRKDGIYLPHMSCKITGPSENFLHGYTARYLFIDELHLADSYGKGAVKKLIGRTDAFTGKKRKIIITSTPGVNGDLLADEINKGLIYRWSWKCPQSDCQQYQPWYWNKQRGETGGEGDGITWDKVKNSDGSYNYEATGATARLVCCHCHKSIEDTKQNRLLLNRTGKYTCVKAGGDSSIKTYQWPAFVNPEITFRSAVVQYLQAKQKFKFTYNDDDLITFYQHVLGEEWNRRRNAFKSKILVENYDPDTVWPEEAYRVMGVDNQRLQSAKYYVIRAFDKQGNSRKICSGHVNSWDEIERIYKEYKVPIHQVFVDCGYQETKGEIYAESVKRGNDVEYADGNYRWKERVGWTCLMGEGKKLYKHADNVTRYYSEPIAQDSGAGLPPARMHLWTNYAIKNILAALRDGKGAVKWSTDKTDNDYIAQLYSEELVDVENKKTGMIEQAWKCKNDNNHFWDCECMIIVGALMLGIPLQG